MRYIYARDFTLKNIRKEVEQIHGGAFTVLSVEPEARRLNVRCNGCEREYKTNRGSLVKQKRGCNVCFNRQPRTGSQATVTPEEYQRRLDAKYNGAVQLIGALTGHRAPRTHKCTKCDNVWVARRIGHCQKCSSRHGQASGQRKKEMQLGTRTVTVQGFEGIAIKRLLQSGVKPENIRTTSDTNRPPVIEYRFRGKDCKHYPDLRVVRKAGDVIVEVKSTVTFGLTAFRKEMRYFAKNKAKAKAALEQGYDYRVMVLEANGSLVKLPKDWHAFDLRTLLRKIDALSPGRVAS